MIKTIKKKETNTTKPTETINFPKWSAEYKAAVLEGKIKEK